MSNVKIVPLDFSAFQVRQNSKTVDKTIPPPEIKAHYPTSFCHIHCPKAATHDRQLMAASCPLHCINHQRINQLTHLHKLKVVFLRLGNFYAPSHSRHFSAYLSLRSRFSSVNVPYCHLVNNTTNCRFNITTLSLSNLNQTYRFPLILFM